MERTRTTELSMRIGETVMIKGWLHALRRLGGVTFVVVRDGWGLAQAVVEDEAALTPLRQSGAGVESVIAVTGIAVAAAQAPGGVEVQRPAITVLEAVTEPPPVTINKREVKAALTAILDHAVVANRHPVRRATLRLAAGVMAGFREVLAGRGYTEIQTPKIVESATEGGANVFQLEYFDRPAYLAQSPQFYKQIMVGLYEGVYEVGPVFRAEPHDTTRHINQYLSLDCEVGFIDDHFTVMSLLRDVLAGIFDHLNDRYAAELALLGALLPTVPATIPHIHFSEAQELIFQEHGIDNRGEPDLAPQDERLLGEWAQRTHGSELLFVTGYPMVKRPFYTHPDPARPQYSNSFDLLFRGLELVTGGQRLHRHRDYQMALARAGLSEAPFRHYLEAFRYGMPPHGGFAIGSERLIMQVLGLSNVRLATTFPRDIHRLSP